MLNKSRALPVAEITIDRPQRVAPRPRTIVSPEQRRINDREYERRVASRRYGNLARQQDADDLLAQGLDELEGRYKFVS